MSVADERLIDVKPAGSFRFGRTVRDHLAEREGISMTALYSDDAEADAAVVTGRGIPSQGGIEFGRDVVLPDGRTDRTATTLRILAAPEFPRLSNFICQQHRPDLIYVPRWMEHANGAAGICQVTILADVRDQPRVCKRFCRLYGEGAVTPEGSTGFSVRTGNGRFLVLEQTGAEALYGELPAVLVKETQPCCISIHVRVASLSSAVRHVVAGGVQPLARTDRLAILPPEFLGNTFLAFEEG
jgi:hypothetical protein